MQSWQFEFLPNKIHKQKKWRKDELRQLECIKESFVIVIIMCCCYCDAQFTPLGRLEQVTFWQLQFANLQR